MSDSKIHPKQVYTSAPTVGGIALTVTMSEVKRIEHPFLEEIQKNEQGYHDQFSRLDGLLIELTGLIPICVDMMVLSAKAYGFSPAGTAENLATGHYLLQDLLRTKKYISGMANRDHPTTQKWISENIEPILDQADKLMDPIRKQAHIRITEKQQTEYHYG